MEDLEIGKCSDYIVMFVFEEECTEKPNVGTYLREFRCNVFVLNRRGFIRNSKDIHK